VRHGRPDRQRRIGDAPAHYDLRAGIERGGDRLGADVGVGADQPHAVHFGPQLLAQQRALCGRGQVVALHHRNARRGNAELARHAGDVAGGCARVRRTEVADDANAMRQAARKHRAQHRVEQRLVARFGIGATA
jgi:hypothetical protein